MNKRRIGDQRCFGLGGFVSNPHRGSSLIWVYYHDRRRRRQGDREGRVWSTPGKTPQLPNPSSNSAVMQVPLERDINIAINGCSGFPTSTQKGPFMAMLILRS